MKRIALLLTVSLFMVSCSTAPKTAEDPGRPAVHALGGPEVLRGVRTVWIKGTARQWEPEQSVVPGGEMRLVNDTTFESFIDVNSNFTRTDWVRKFAYPAPRTYTFTEVVTTNVGYVSGIDSSGRTRQSLDSEPACPYDVGAAAGRHPARAAACLRPAPARHVPQPRGRSQTCPTRRQAASRIEPWSTALARPQPRWQPPRWANHGVKGPIWPRSGQTSSAPARLRR